MVFYLVMCILWFIIMIIQVIIALIAWLIWTIIRRVVDTCHEVGDTCVCDGTDESAPVTGEIRTRHVVLPGLNLNKGLCGSYRILHVPFGLFKNGSKGC